VILLRKIAHYFDQKLTDRLNTNDSLIDTNRNGPGGLGSQDEVVLKIDIESAMRLKNPLSDLDAPNSFVQIRLPFRGASPDSIHTSVV